MPFTIVDEPNYARQLEQIGDVQRLDEALNSLMWALANKPEVFDIVVESDPPIRLAKTRRFGTIPRVWLWFRIEYEHEQVVLMAIKAEGQDVAE